jgi:hypothetical protein
MPAAGLETSDVGNVISLFLVVSRADASEANPRMLDDVCVFHTQCERPRHECVGTRARALRQTDQHGRSRTERAALEASTARIVGREHHRIQKHKRVDRIARK